MTLSEREKKIMAKVQSKGGQAIMKKRGKGWMKEIGKRGLDARWKNREIKKTTDQVFSANAKSTFDVVQ